MDEQRFFLCLHPNEFCLQKQPLSNGAFLCGTIEGVKITLPIPVKLSLNVIYAGVHYRVRKQHKDLYRELVWAMVRQKYTGSFPVVITYTFHFKGRKLDSSNCAYLVKLMEDGLVHAEVLPDDDGRYVYGTCMFVGDKAEEDSVEISIDPC